MRSTKIQPNKENVMKKPQFSLNRLLGVTYILVALIIVLSGLKFWLLSLRYNALFDTTTYQAVTLTNGQTFFGHLMRYGINTYVLTDVYYLQRNQNDSTAETTAASEADANETTDVPADQNTTNEEKTDTGLSLQAIVDDLHQPYNYMVLNRSQIIFWQSLNQSSPILETIAKSKKKEE